MTCTWLKGFSEADLEFGKAAMATNMVAGDTLAIQKWRYSPIGCVAYAILRSAVYCIRHFRRDDVYSSGPGPTYIYFTPTCEISLRAIEREFPGNIIGFKGRVGHNFPLGMLFLATIICFRSPAILRWVLSDRRWRPWISDVIFYIMTMRWAERRFAGIPSQVFVYSNDHCCFDRGIVDAVAALGNITVYVQHSAVTDIFPPLSAQFSLLDGEQALNVYSEIEGSRGIVMVCGRQYEIAALRKIRRVTPTALICTSTIDSVESWRSVIAVVRDAGFQVFLRTHPSDRQVPNWQRMATDTGIVWLDPHEHSLACALEQSSVVLAGQSGVLLEAALSGATAIIVQFVEDAERGLYDYFGFAKAGLACLALPDEVGAVLERIKGGERIVSSDGISYFDIAASCEKNMQLKAMEAIMSGDRFDDGHKIEGFGLPVSQSNDKLEVYFPIGQGMSTKKS